MEFQKIRSGSAADFFCYGFGKYPKLCYNIINEGEGASPNACSNIKIAYEGKLTSDFVFDANDGIDFPLTQLITGWRLGLPLIKEGGEIILYLPPNLAYGSSARPNIPANSILVFKIELHKVK